MLLKEIIQISPGKQIQRLVVHFSFKPQFYFFYILKAHVKFYVIQMLFTIRSIDLFFNILLDYKNSKFKNLIDKVIIDLCTS